MRTYGILINEKKEILLSDEQYKGIAFTKFPGGGVCLGESLPEALRREFMEECDLRVRVKQLLHLTDIVVSSAFDDSQVIGAYFQVEPVSQDATIMRMENMDLEMKSSQSFRWVSLADFSNKDLYFEMDKHAWRQMENDIYRLIR